MTLSTGGGPGVRLVAGGDGLTVRRARGGLGQVVFFAIMAMVSAAMAVAGSGVAVFLAWGGVAEGSGLLLLLAPLFAVAAIPAWLGFLALQGRCFEFTVTVKDNRYRLVNGLLRLSLKMDPREAEVVIFPFYNRGAWGYGTRMRLRRGSLIPLPLTGPCGSFSSIGGARAQALELHEWLRRHSGLGSVVMPSLIPPRSGKRSRWSEFFVDTWE